ncbi:hypothetical protein IQ246_23280 [aff. Roholtiella sp. LEGE 12411]|uniref:DUF6174 domain-containing protein n=2 Tax=aff. Roholtiella sp. LEGE 12411 TaxID=1828822 RepID=UPI001880763F|nr:DUF6174 domain-containing protein [aff. Roholtiella sp. LEGE 12411]MBE9037976.1 hypothetical protein [aff. Roholtiella sp. LEGE 12411]
MRLPIVISAGLLIFLGLNTPVMPKSPVRVAQSSEITNSKSKQLTTNPQLKQLRINHRLWRQQKINNYRYTLSNSCFCIPEARGPVVIEVRNGRTTSITSVNTGQPVANPEFFQTYNTVPKLFHLIRNTISNGNEQSELAVEYNPELGYPTQINIGNLAADAGIFTTIENLQKIR